MKNLNVSISAGTKMSSRFKQDLLDGGVSTDVVEALRLAMENLASGPGGAYAGAMETAFTEYGIEGVKHQVMYMLINAGSWKGESARLCKKVLKKWSSK